ncbi:MAG TPA: alanine racemase [Actinobacteria bacterium]|nr:alanine racemase [Actinomycetota bacterium]
MAFAVTIDAARWRDHQDAVCDAVRRAAQAPLVPVIKGNGYGLGQRLLADEAIRLAADTVAVGTVFEVADVAEYGTFDIIVLEPFEPRDAYAADEWWRLGQQLHAGRVIRTIASKEALLSLAAGHGSVRVVLEAQTSMHRFGMDEAELLRILGDPRVREALARGRILVEGLALHLPLAQPADEDDPRRVALGTAKVREVVRWAGLWAAETDVWSGHNSPECRVWVSHLDDAELASVTSSVPDVVLRARVGTRLWLDRSTLRAAGTVLAVHPLPAGTHVGYRQRTGPKDGTLVVVSGGTSHGIGLTAPTPASSVRQRVVTAGTGALDAAGRALSPFTWQGRQRWFAEPPHQHVSMIWLPAGVMVPAVGDRLTAEVRYTTSRFDAVLGVD